MSMPVKETVRKPSTEETKRSKKEEDEYMSDASTETSESEAESDYSDSDEDEEVLFDFSLSLNKGRRILRKGDCVNHFAIDVLCEAAKLGCELHKKENSIRVRGATMTLKFACEGDDGRELIDEAFEDITGENEASDEAKLLAFMLAYVPPADDDDTKKKRDD